MSKETPRTFPAGCKIINICNGGEGWEDVVFAVLVGPDGDLLISATLEYISRQLIGATIQEETDG